jgi:hypothetical protein
MPVTFHEQPKNAVAQDDGDSKRAKTKLPAIPDLRFEYSYLKNIQPFVKIKRVATRAHAREGEVEVAEESPREIIEIEWGKVLWITLRDQVISPLLQGTLWWVQENFPRVYRF